MRKVCPGRGARHEYKLNDHLLPTTAKARVPKKNFFVASWTVLVREEVSNQAEVSWPLTDTAATCAENTRFPEAGTHLALEIRLASSHLDDCDVEQVDHRHVQVHSLVCVCAR